MKTAFTAFSVWNGRIAPVFDVARQIHLLESESGQIIQEEQHEMPSPFIQKAIRLTELGIEQLVCGAISRPLHATIEAYGINVIPFIAGDLREIVRAWISGKLENENFAMPGCCGRKRRRFRKGNFFEEEDYFMQGRNQGGNNPGGGQGIGRRGGPGGPGGYCACPQCGHREPHQRGIPCARQQCPKCQIAMIRE